MHCEWGGKIPKIAPSRWDFVTLPDEDQATTTGNTHKKLSNDHACGSGERLAGRLTKIRHTDVLITILYIATAPVGEVKSHL